MLDHLLADLEEKEPPEGEPDLPYETLPTDEEVALLPGVTLWQDAEQTQQVNKTIIALYTDLWQLTEFRTRLSAEHLTEQAWWESLYSNLSKQIVDKLASLSPFIEEDSYSELNLISEQVFTGTNLLTEQDFAHRMHQFISAQTIKTFDFLGDE